MKVARLLSSLVRHSMMQGCVAAALALAAMPAEALAAPPATLERIQSALKSSSKSDRELKAFYRANRYRPLWIRGGTIGPEADRLVELISSADLDGIDPNEYRPHSLADAIDEARDGHPKRLARAEILLTRALIEYVRDVRRPSANAEMVYIDEELRPQPTTTREILEAVSAAPSLREYLDTVGRVNPLYAGLRDGLADYRERWSELPSVAIEPGPLLKLGATGERVRRLRARLGLPYDGPLDETVAEAIREFQAAHGLPADAVVGPRTLAALNAPPGEHERVLRLNLERARALPANIGDRHIVVDAAAARLYLYEDGQVKDTMKVIVGKPEQQTPMVAGLIRYAVLNPYWNVPPDLVKERIAPHVLKKGIGYLMTMGYEILSDWTDNAHVIDPRDIDWKSVAAGETELRIRQLPGRLNAMGRMKFMFPNDMGIWLHDTPDKNLFDEDDRRFSAGCVRVEDAPRLAEWLFGKPLVAESAKPEQHVALSNPVPVYITYLTAAASDRGVAFRNDVYRRDKDKARTEIPYSGAGLTPASTSLDRTLRPQRPDLGRD